MFGEALASGGRAMVYADGIPSNCALDNLGDQHGVKHNPWPYCVNEQPRCQQYDVPAGRLPGDVASGRLPNVGMVIPNMCHDAHDCDLSVADDWIRRTLTDVLTGSDWKSGHLAVVITAGSDDRHSHNKVLTVVVHASQHRNLVDRRLNHYSLSRPAVGGGRGAATQRCCAGALHVRCVRPAGALTRVRSASGGPR